MGTKMGGTSETGPTKLKLYNHSCYTHEIFRVGKYEKIKFDKIWGYQNEGIPLNKNANIQTLTILTLV